MALPGSATVVLKWTKNSHLCFGCCHRKVCCSLCRAELLAAPYRDSAVRRPRCSRFEIRHREPCAPLGREVRGHIWLGRKTVARVALDVQVARHCAFGLIQADWTGSLCSRARRWLGAKNACKHPRPESFILRPSSSSLACLTFEYIRAHRVLSSLLDT